jgi:DNA primase
MSYISESTIREVNDRLDAAAVVGDYVRLEKRGGKYWGLCPFHNEKTPSFTVDPDKKMYYCFGCNHGGGVINFIMEMDKLSFPEAVETLAKRMGIEIIYENTGGERKEGGENRRIEELAELYRRVAGSFYYLLMKKDEGAEAKRYIISRGITKEMIDRFRLGYAPADRSWLFRFLSEKGYSGEFLASSGLFSKSNPRRAFFADRLMFPIADRQGRTIAFGGRILAGEGPKYLNSGESGGYKKRETLFAIDLALPEIRKTKEVYVAEGYMDVIALHQAGIANAVAPLGTAFTDDQAKLLRRWAERVLLVFDADEAGQNAAVKAILTCRRNALACFVVTMADKPGTGAQNPGMFKDPADILKELGPEALQKSVKCFINDFEYLVRRGGSLFDLSNSEGKGRAAAFLFPYLGALDSEVSRDSCVGAMADAFGIERQAILADFSRFNRGQFDPDRRDGEKREGNRDAGPGRNARPIRMNDELFLLTAVLVNPGLYPRLRAALSIEELDDPGARELFIALEEWFRNDTPGMDDLLSRIQDETLRNFVVHQGASAAFSDHLDQLVADGIKRVKQKRLERRRSEIVRELRIAKNADILPHQNGFSGGTHGGLLAETRVEDLLAEKVHIDAELRRMKEATE